MNRYQERINKLRPLIKEAGLDALFINDVANVAYFTGKKGDDCYLYISMDDAYIITDFRYQEMAEGFKDWLKLELTKKGNNIVDILRNKPEVKIGVEKEAMTLDLFMVMNSGLKEKNFVPVSGIVEKLRKELSKDIDLLDLKQLNGNPELLRDVLGEGIRIYVQGK